MAFEPLGWEPVFFSEIEPFPKAVLAEHYPDVPDLGDMTDWRDWPTELLVEVDVLVAGTPCQSFSIAGLRQSLDDDRGNLALDFIRICNAIDNLRSASGRPGIKILWENVPGVLNTKDNAFGCFLGALAGEDGALEPPGGSVDERRLRAWPQKSNRVAGARRPIFRSGPTTPPCVCCRMSSKRGRSQRDTF